MFQIQVKNPIGGWSTLATKPDENSANLLKMQTESICKLEVRIKPTT